MTESINAARDLIDRYWEKLLELEPLLGTMVGDERYDDRLPDPSDVSDGRREPSGGRGAKVTGCGAAGRPGC